MRPERHSPVRWRRRLTVRLTAGVIAVLLLVGAPFLIAFHKLLRREQLHAYTVATNELSRLVVDSLRSAMLAGYPHLLNDAVRGLAEHSEVSRILLIDHDSRVRVSSDAAFTGRVLDRDREPTCRVCHRFGSGLPASRTAVTDEGGHRIFRTMTLIHNEPQCHRCHDPLQTSNGVLLMDFALEAADRRFFADIRSSLVLGALMVVITILVLVLLLRRMVHNPLRAMVTASERIVGGDLSARASVSSPGEIGQLAYHVNRMTDHLSRSITVANHQRQKAQAILDSVDDEIVVLDEERRVVAANEAFRRRFAKSDADIVGKYCHEVSGSEWSCAVGPPGGCPVERVFETGRLNKGIVSRPETDGTERVMEVHASPLRGPEGTVNQVVEVRRDISERRQMEAILAHSEHLASLGLLASGLSHEINNPLGAIATSVEGLRRRLSTQKGISPSAARGLEQALERIGHEVQRGRAITHRLLRVARPPNATRSLVDVNHVVEDIVAVLSAYIKRTGVETHLELAGNLAPIPTNEQRLAQVIMNLVLNAVQSMAEKGGSLRISTSNPNGGISIEVEDTGCGIPPEFLKRIFEPFFTTKPVGTGTGLGLFITHQIVTQLGGEVHVRSWPGIGTTFTVDLPQVEGGRES